MTDITYRGYVATADGKALPVVNPRENNEGNNEIKTMSAEEFEALTTEQKTTLYNEGVRVIAVDGELDPDNMTDMQRFADFTNPVGTIREFNVPTNPATLFGVGTWESYMPGRVLVGAGAADFGINFSAGQTGGEASHTLTTNEMPSHIHDVIQCLSGTAGDAVANGTENGNITVKDYDAASQWFSPSNTGVGKYGWGAHTQNSGGGQPHNNMQPYAVVYRWLRVA